MKDLALFSALSPAERQQVARMAGKKIYQKGEMVFYDGDPAETIYLVKSGQIRSMSAEALEPSFVCTCTRGDFERMIIQNPAVGLKLIKALGEKLNNYTGQMADMAFRDVRGRLINTLQRLARDYGKPDGDGLLISIHLTHQDLASLVNASRVMVTNSLNRLKQEGVIAMNKNNIVLKAHTSS